MKAVAAFAPTASFLAGKGDPGGGRLKTQEVGLSALFTRRADGCLACSGSVAGRGSFSLLRFCVFVAKVEKKNRALLMATLVPAGRR